MRLASIVIALTAVLLAPAVASASGISYSAVIDRDGNRKSGFGLVGWDRIAPGVVRLAFETDVSACAYVASVGNFRGKAPLDPGLVSVASGGGADVMVYTTNLDGRAHGRGFHLDVACPSSDRARNPSAWAVVDADATLARGSRATAVLGSDGSYEVLFDHFVKRCAMTVSVGDAGTADTAPGLAIARPAQGRRNGVDVETLNASGDRVAAGFHLNVRCIDEMGPSFSAVIGDTGALVRGLGAAGASRVARGEYEVDFPQDVSTCNFTAAIGDAGTGGPSRPGLIDVAGREGNANAVLVRTFGKNGRASNRGFHLIVAC